MKRTLLIRLNTLRSYLILKGNSAHSPHYCTHFDTDSYGSTQLVTYTAQNLFSEYRPEAEQFLSGLVLADKIPEESVNPAEKPAE